MAFKIRRGTNAERLTITPAEGELIYTTDTKKLYIGDGSTVGGITVGDTDYVDQKITDLIDGAGATLDTLKELADALGGDDNFAANLATTLAGKADTSSLATVATSGDYDDLTNKPTLFSGDYDDLTDKPTLFSGNYDDLTNKPTIPSISGLATETYVDTAVSNLVNSAGPALDTLKELADALGNDANFATTVSTSLSNKANSADVYTKTEVDNLLWDGTSITNDLIPDTDITYDIGSPTNRFKDIYLSSNTIYLGETALGVDPVKGLQVKSFGGGEGYGAGSVEWLASGAAYGVLHALKFNGVDISHPLYTYLSNLKIGDQIKEAVPPNDPTFVPPADFLLTITEPVQFGNIVPDGFGGQLYDEVVIPVDQSRTTGSTYYVFYVEFRNNPITSIDNIPDPDGILPTATQAGWPEYGDLGITTLRGDQTVFIRPSWDRNTVDFQFKEDGTLQLPPGGDIVDSAGASVLFSGSYNDLSDTPTIPVVPTALSSFTNDTNFITLSDVPTIPTDVSDLTDTTGLLGGGGGGSTTLEYLELTNDPFIFEPYADDPVTFTKTDYGSEVDNIDTDIAITRGENQGIYNPLLETNWDDTTNDGPSPAGTLWNVEGWTDLTNLNQRPYYSFYEAFDGGIGNKVLASEAIMKDVANNKYYKFDFTVWGNNNNGAPVTYTRTEVDPVTGTDIGSPVEFVKAGYDDPTVVNDPIDTNVTLARGNNQSIFNIALETAYNTQGDGEDSPEGTLWNADGWGNLKNTTTRSYVTFQEALNGAIGENILNKELIMWDTINNKYHAFKFSSWTQNSNGGGFSYTRQLINTSNLFIKPDNDTSTIDIFIPDDGAGAGVGITRDYEYGIYNPYREGGWDDTISPGGTAWNIEGWNDLSDIETRIYQPFYAAFGFGGLGNKVVDTECVMFIPDNGKYYAIKFLSWTSGGGGGFSYLRYELDLTKLNQGIKFADGTTLKSAEGVGRVKLTAPNDRRIEQAYGYKEVTVTSITTTNLTATASRNGVNENSIWIDSTTTTIDDILNNTGAAGIWQFNTIEFSLDNSTWYRWGGGAGSSGDERSYGLILPANILNYNQGDTIYFRYNSGGEPVVWWDKAELPSDSGNFRGAKIDYHAYTGEATIIGTIHIVDDDSEENITHTEVSSGSTDSENDDLWLIQNEGTISYRRIDGEGKTLKVQWSATVFYGSELYD